MEKKKILIADDEKEIAFLLFEFLENKGYDVSFVRTSRELYCLLSGAYDHYDLVITDIHMQDGDGDESVELAKVFGSETPVIYITGCDDSLTMSRVTLQKPFSLQEIINRIEEVIK